MTVPNLNEQMDLLRRGAVDIILESELEHKISESIKTGRPLRIKYGADPSAPDIHLGHTVCIRKMRQFQDLGHEIFFIIGDFTGRIGDPSGRSVTRRQLSEEEVLQNAETYKTQIYKILDPAKTKVVFNSNWLSKLNFTDVIHLASKYTVARMLERDEFHKRYTEEKPISVHEFLYPFAQAYDSVAIEADVELGGTDQTFNFLLTREIQKEYGQSPQVILTMPLLVGTDGCQKMSKSLGNYVGVDDPPSEMYGKVMSIQDQLIIQYFRLLTAIPETEIVVLEKAMSAGELNPRDAKMRLAREIVHTYYGQEAARQAENDFVTVFQKKGVPDAIPEVQFDASLLEPGGSIPLSRLLVITGLVASGSEARRLLAQGGIRVNDNVPDNWEEFVPETGMLLRIGKRKFAKLNIIN